MEGYNGAYLQRKSTYVLYQKNADCVRRSITCCFAHFTPVDAGLWTRVRGIRPLWKFVSHTSVLRI